MTAHIHKGNGTYFVRCATCVYERAATTIDHAARLRADHNTQHHKKEET